MGAAGGRGRRRVAVGRQPGRGHRIRWHRVPVPCRRSARHRHPARRRRSAVGADEQLGDLHRGHGRRSTGGAPRIEDRSGVGKQITFTYYGMASTGTCPTTAGFESTLRTGMLCKVTFPDGSSTGLFYIKDTANNFYLSRVENPGTARTDYAYSNGRLSEIRDPLVADVTDPAINVSTDYRTLITYDSAGRVATVTAPKAKTTDTTRAGFSVFYTSATESRVLVAGLDNTSDPNDWDRKVTFDETARWTVDLQATNANSSGFVEKTATWDAKADYQLMTKAQRSADDQLLRSSWMDHRTRRAREPVVLLLNPASGTIAARTAPAPTLRCRTRRRSTTAV